MVGSLSYGLVGYGSWGKLHAQAIDHASNATLTAIVCRSDESAAAARRDFPQVVVSTDIEVLLERGDIDVVDIVLPSHLHCDTAVRALDARKHVLLEKPMALSVTECDEIIEAAERNGRQVSVGHELRLSHQWKAVKDIIDAGDIGEVLYCNSELFRFPYRQGAGGWRYSPDSVGSWILEEPIHFLDLTLWYFERVGEPAFVRAFATTKSQDASGLYDNFTAVIGFGGKDDAIAPYAIVSQTLDGFEHHQVVEVTGTEGSIRALWSGAADRDSRPTFSVVAQRRGETHSSNVELQGESGEIFELDEEIVRTTEAFLAGRPLFSAEKGKRVVELCLAAEQSIREKRDVRLGDVTSAS